MKKLIFAILSLALALAVFAVPAAAAWTPSYDVSSAEESMVESDASDYGYYYGDSEVPSDRYTSAADSASRFLEDNSAYYEDASNFIENNLSTSSTESSKEEEEDENRKKKASSSDIIPLE